MIKCFVCGITLGKYKDGKFIVRKESHKDMEIFIDGVLKVICPCGAENFIKENT